MRKIFVFSVLCFCSLFSRADESVIGHWQTTQIFDGFPVVIDIVITQLELKDESTKISFASPRNCEINFQYSGLVGDEEFFYVSKGLPRGSWCRRSMPVGKDNPSFMKVKTNDDGELQYDLFRSAARVEGGIAKKTEIEFFNMLLNLK